MGAESQKIMAETVHKLAEELEKVPHGNSFALRHASSLKGGLAASTLVPALCSILLI